MSVPDISALTIEDLFPTTPQDIQNGTDKYTQKLKHYAKSIPYSIEPNSKMQSLLDFILLRITQCVEAKDYEPGLLQWDGMLTYWLMLKYPIPKEKRMKVAKLFYHLCATPGISSLVAATCADAFRNLTKSKRKLSVEDMRLPWKPVFDIISQDLFLSRRQFEYTQLTWYMGYLAESASRFYHPAAVNEMLQTFVPLINGTSLTSVLSAQYYLLTFLPLSHPQSYLPMLSRLWEAINSYMFDERMFHFLSKLAELHVDPSKSNPQKITEIPDDEVSPGEGRPKWDQSDLSSERPWNGIFKDVGIFTEHEWQLVMCKCLASFEIPLADSGSLSTGSNADSQVGFEIGRLPKAAWRIPSLARIIVYSMFQDGIPSLPSTASTPFFTPQPSGTNTPQIQATSITDYLSAPLGKSISQTATYIAGSRALDSLVSLIASTENFFHPSNSGDWTSDLSAFIKFVVYEFNKRWHEERSPECKTPPNRRLTLLMRYELVKSLRTVVLLAIFSQDPATVVNIQSCLKSMSVMEPGLILLPVLERAVPSLEALVETQRTIAVIKALGAVAPAIVSRQVYHPGAKHLVAILQLLIPGIDLNDPAKTLCTTSFLVEISQYIRFGDLTTTEESPEPEQVSTPNSFPKLSFSLGDLELPLNDQPPQLSKKEEDQIVKDSTGSFADWIASFIRRVIQLLENLPEEGADGSLGGTTETQVVDAVTGACSQICVHLSEPLYDLVLNMVYDYASTNVRSNAVRAIHQLVECVANANPNKTLARFVPFCSHNIKTELENGASSVRTTSSSSSIPSDATLHWNLACLRGATYNDGRAILIYEEEFVGLLKLLRDKAYSKRGFSWTGKLLSSILLTLTHTYPLENKFVNPEEWSSEDFIKNHHKYWGKLYGPGEVKVSWHVPSAEEIDFCLRIFKDLVEPALTTLEGLLKPGNNRDAIWRNDFCRHLNFVRYAFSGVPTLSKESMPLPRSEAFAATSDLIDEIPEMIGTAEPLKSGFCLDDPNDPRHLYYSSVRHRFGTFLHQASVSLSQQGEENIVDAVLMLIRSVKTYMLDYGDSRDSYYSNDEQYGSEKSVATYYAGQKEWPRAVHVRRARFYHSARLRWNSVEKHRGPLEDSLIDDVVEWSLCHYAIKCTTSQELLESLCSIYDGVRRRALPVLYAALEPGTEDDRMKGALWTLNRSSFGKYAVSEPTLATRLINCLFACQHNEKPSIQECVALVAETCFGSFPEPSFLVYDIDNSAVNNALTALKTSFQISEVDKEVVCRCTKRREERVVAMKQATDETTKNLLGVGTSSRTHWKYTIGAVRCLRSLVRQDAPPMPSLVRFFFDKLNDDNPTVRYYAQRAIMKSLRNIKHRTYCSNASDLLLGICHNPLKSKFPVPELLTADALLGTYKVPISENTKSGSPIFGDNLTGGWLAWRAEMELYKLPDPIEPTFVWERASTETVQAVRSITCDQNFWERISVYYSEENHEDTMLLDNVSCIKSIFQLLGDDPLASMKGVVEELFSKTEQGSQRAAAELLAGVLGGSKHWPTQKQKKLWEWLFPFIRKIFGQSIKSDTISIWMSFIEYLFYHRDPRRLQPLVDLLIEQFYSTDLNGDSSLDAVKILSYFRAFYEGLGWKFSPWTEETLERYWSEIHGEHEDVRAYVSEMLAFSTKIAWRPKISTPTVESFVQECRRLPPSYDIMNTRGSYHKGRVLELVDKFKVWRLERTPGVRAFHSNYDRVGITICRWLFQLVHDLRAVAAFDYILPLLPEIFRFSEANDNQELVLRANQLLIRMCGVTPPHAMVGPILQAITDAIESSPSWKVRLRALPLVQVFYFRQAPLMDNFKIIHILEVLCRCLDDEVVEVREMAATTLSGILRLSPRRSVLTLKDRFVRLLNDSGVPERSAPDYNKALRQKHAAILGICALVESFPYTVEKWLPGLLTDVLAEHAFDPIPISTTINECARNFKKTHQDTWHEDSKRFNEEQLSALSSLLTGSSYYA